MEWKVSHCREPPFSWLRWQAVWKQKDGHEDAGLSLSFWPCLCIRPELAVSSKEPAGSFCQSSEPRPSIYPLLDAKYPLFWTCWDHIPLFEGTRRVLESSHCSEPPCFRVWMAGCLKAKELAKGQHTTSGVLCDSLVPRRSKPLLHGCGGSRLVAIFRPCLSAFACVRPYAPHADSQQTHESLSHLCRSCSPCSAKPAGSCCRVKVSCRREPLFSWALIADCVRAQVHRATFRNLCGSLVCQKIQACLAWLWRVQACRPRLALFVCVRTHPYESHAPLSGFLRLRSQH